MVSDTKARPAQYDGITEVFDGNTTWADVVLKDDASNASSGSNYGGGTGGTIDRTVYVRKNN